MRREIVLNGEAKYSIYSSGIGPEADVWHVKRG